MVDKSTKFEIGELDDSEVNCGTWGARFWKFWKKRKSGNQDIGKECLCCIDVNPKTHERGSPDVAGSGIGQLGNKRVEKRNCGNWALANQELGGSELGIRNFGKSECLESETLHRVGNTILQCIRTFHNETMESSGKGSGSSANC